MNINVDPDWGGPDGGSTATSDRGAGPLGFAGALAKSGSAATGLATLADDDFGGGPVMPMVPATWNAGHERRGGTRRRARLMRQRATGVDAEVSLAWLLEPLSVETFLDEIWGKDHYHFTSARTFDALLPEPSTVEGLLELFRHEPSALRLVRGKDKKGPDSYRLADGTLDVASVRNDFADGYTIVMDGVEQYARTIGTLARSLEVELNFPAQVNTYITPAQSSGLVPHYDDHDVLILQIQGSKTWHLYVGADLSPREIQRDTDKAVVLESLPAPSDVHLEAGDVLYVPRGRVHAAETHSEPSIHLTVGIHAPTVLMLAISAVLAELPRRPSECPAAGPSSRRCGAGRTVRDLVLEAVATVRAPDALTTLVGRLSDALVRRGKCPPVGQIAIANTVATQTRVVKYEPPYSRVKAADGGVTRQLPACRSTPAPTTPPRCDSSLRTAPFQVGDLPGLRPNSRRISPARSS